MSVFRCAAVCGPVVPLENFAFRLTLPGVCQHFDRSDKDRNRNERNGNARNPFFAVTFKAFSVRILFRSPRERLLYKKTPRKQTLEGALR
jgi:hypothetical protein